MTGHPHAELMAQYAEDAKTNDRPYLLWEYKGGSTWINLEGHPLWNPKIEYRRKRDVIRVGGYEFPKPYSTKLVSGQRYWFVSIGPGIGFSVHPDRWEGAETDRRRLRTGLIHMSQEDAEEHAEVLNKIHQVK